MEQYIGAIQMFGFNFPPVQMTYCNGQILAISQNTALFALIGVTYGGNGQTTFALPNLQGRGMVHPGQGPGLSPITWGQVAGVESVTMGISNLPAHTHGVSIAVNNNPGEEAQPFVLAGRTNGYSTSANPAGVLGAVTQQNFGQGQPFNVLNPYLGINFCIALTGIFPSRN